MQRWWEQEGIRFTGAWQDTKVKKTEEMVRQGDNDAVNEAEGIQYN